ncbi:MAG: acyltransferase [Oscillospiraceae bacterium]|nr:acyltransferase [Oscillospiraceae bacterium]
MELDFEALKDLEISDEEFFRLTRFANWSDNGPDDARRGRMLGFGDRGVLVAPGAIIRIPREQVGKNIFIGLYSYLNGNVTIEDDCLIGPHCSLAAGNHKFDPATGCFSARTEHDYDNSIVIGKGSWLASSVTVTAGVKIGKANLVCAGAVVTKSTPDYAIIAGMPAKQIGRIDPETGEYIWFSHEKKDEA